MSNIPGTPADGKVRRDVLVAVEDINAMTAAEYGAVTGVNVSCYVTAGGFVFSPEQAAITDDRECDTFTAEQPGRTSVSGATITVIDNTGTSLSATDNAAVDALVPGSTVYIVSRYGLDYDTTPAAAQIVDVIKAIVGKKQRVAIEANSVLRSTYPLFIQDFAQDVAVAA